MERDSVHQGLSNEISTNVMKTSKLLSKFFLSYAYGFNINRTKLKSNLTNLD